MTTPSPTTLLSDEERMHIECGLLDGRDAVQRAASDAAVVLPLTRIERARWELRLGRARLALDEIARMAMDDDERDALTRRHWQEAQAANRAAGLVLLIWLCGWLLLAGVAVWWLR